MRFAQLCAIALVLIGSRSITVKAAVLTNNIQIGSLSNFGQELFQVTQPGQNGLFALLISSNQPGQYTMSAWGIAELYSVHSAFSGLEFTPSYVRGSAPLLNNMNNPGSFQFSLGIGQSILFAYWDDLYGPFPNPSAFMVPDEYDGYGWFQLTRTFRGLTVSGSATAVGGGIIVGTYTQIPEPSVATVFVLVAVGVLVWRRQIAVATIHQK